MKCVLVILLIGLQTIVIESRTAWVYTVSSNKSSNTNSTALQPRIPLNVSNSDVITFVKVLNLLRQQLEYEVKEQDEGQKLRRILMKCNDLEEGSGKEGGVILPIPDPLEDLTLLSLLYDDTANWSKCTRSCKSQRLRKCRARGLCSMDYLVEEAFCFFPESKCAKKVQKLIKQLVNETRTNQDEKLDYSDEDQDNPDYDDPHHHNNEKDYAQNQDYAHTHDEDYAYHEGGEYGHSHHDYDYPDDGYYKADNEDYPTYENINYDDGPDMGHYDSDYFWDNNDYSYGDPDASYDCADCTDNNFDDYGNDSEEDLPEEDEADDEDDDTCGKSYAGVPKRSFRIIGGHRAVKGAWPWQVAIFDRYGANFCGGTIIAPRWVLTAGHCVKPGIRVKIAEYDVSRYDGEVDIKVRKAFVHPKFNAETYDRDIALLKLPRSVFTAGKPFVKKACLPKKTVKLPKKKLCVVLGWGSEKESHIYGSDILMYAKVPIVSDRKCYEAYSDFYMTKHMLCAGFLRGGPDTCSGDSGGPLLCQNEEKEWVIHGITSFGDGCGQKGRFGVYAKVKDFVYWINRTITAN